ncbi:MAG: oligoendopeptidase F, partial [Oscillospiraceae bacterium]|nr:oligoendopeptidase F [Oscillospiraceae bacterium]
MATEMKIPKRSEVDSASCWCVTDIFPSDEAWSQAFEACQNLPKEAASYQGRLGGSAQALLEFLELMEKTGVQVESLFVYTMLRHDEDTANPTYQAMRGRCMSFLTRLNSASAFSGPELVGIPEETLNGFYQELPALEKYRRYLTKARLEKDHVLSPAEENLLAAAGEVGRGPSSIFNSFHDADMKFPQVADSQGKAHSLTNG